MQTRRDTSVFLIGCYQPQIIGSKLPSKGDVLKVFFYNVREVNKNVDEAAKLVIEEATTFWNKARVPTKHFWDSVKKLKVLYNEWQKLQKNSARTSETAVNQRNTFVNELDNLFDIAHENAMDLIKIQEDKDFLVAQRKPGREGYQHGINWDLVRKEERAEVRKKKQAEREKRYQESLAAACSSGDCVAGSQEYSSEDDSDSDYDGEEPPVKRTRGTKKIFTLRVVASLDKTKLSDRSALHVIFAIFEALEIDPTAYAVNRASLQRARIKLRAEAAQKLKEHFKTLDLRFVTLHWDGKIMKQLTGSEKCDRIAIIISCGDMEQILKIPAIEGSTGYEQADVCYGELVEWGLIDIFESLCCDRTNSNVGRIKGAATILEQKAERDILYLPCRKHGKEVVLRGAFDSKNPPSTSPEVSLFNRFKAAWPNMDHTQFDTDQGVIEILENDRDRIIAFTDSILKTKNKDKIPRDDYREFLILSQIFLCKFDKNVKFNAPGPTHHARWMAKAIYCLKMHLFRAQFEFREGEEQMVQDLSVFIIKLYIEAWFTAPLTTRAPNHDLQFLRKLHEFKNIDPIISKATVGKMINHLYFLTPECCGLSFYDETIDDEIKKKMVAALSREPLAECGKKFILKDIEEIKGKDISDFICKDTNKFFQRFGLSTNFLKLEPSKWLEDADFMKDRNNVRRLRSVNDVAERGVKLIQEYSGLLTTSEEQLQYVLQLVSEYTKKFSKVTKESLSEPMFTL